MNPRISAQHISKRFRIERGPRAILHMLIQGNAKKRTTIQALEDVSVEVSAGEVVGILGANGSGKSTLLRIIAGLYRHDAGSVSMTGIVRYLGGFSPSTNPYLTLRENIYLIAALMGLRKHQIRANIDSIAAFAGLTDFLDMQTLKLSSGMITRLNVSTVFHCLEETKPNILLLDEILSAGSDLEFRQRSLRKVSELVRGGAAVIMVSHDLALLEECCDSLLWLEKGVVRARGKPADIIAEYSQVYG